MRQQIYKILKASGKTDYPWTWFDPEIRDPNTLKVKIINKDGKREEVLLNIDLSKYGPQFTNQTPASLKEAWTIVRAQTIQGLTPTLPETINIPHPTKSGETIAISTKGMFSIAKTNEQYRPTLTQVTQVMRETGMTEAQAKAYLIKTARTARGTR